VTIQQRVVDRDAEAVDEGDQELRTIAEMSAV
jgi:hypothetical protein